MRLAVVLLVCVTAGVVHAAPPAIVFTGNANITSAELRAGLADPFEGGKLDQEMFERYLLEVAVFYWDRGYAQVKVGDPTVTPTQVTIPITEGVKYSLGTILVTGDPPNRAKEKHRASLESRTGATFSRTKIANDRTALSRIYEDQGYAYVNVIPLTKVDLALRTIAVTFEITRGPRVTVEQVGIDCKSVPDAATRIPIAIGNRFSTSRLEAGKRALVLAGGVDVVMYTKRGSTDDQVIVGYECQ